MSRTGSGSGHLDRFLGITLVFFGLLPLLI